MENIEVTIKLEDLRRIIDKLANTESIKDFISVDREHVLSVLHLVFLN